MRERVLYICLILFLMIKPLVYSQDPQFSQFYSNPLYLAPSFAGLITDTRLTINGRVQWVGVTEPFRTISVGLDHNFETFNSGVGVFIMSDQAGTGQLTTNTLALNYAYEFKLSKFWYLRPGITLKYAERRVDFSKLLWADQISAAGNATASSELPPEKLVGDIDAGSSIMTYSDKLWFGFGVDHLMQSNQSLYSLDGEDQNGKPIGYIPIKYTFFGGTKIINKGRLINPYDASIQIAALYRIQEDFNQLDIGLYWYNKPLVLGVWYRGMVKREDKISRDAFILMTGIKFETFNIGYSYDFTISGLIGSTSGSHEVSLSYSFETRAKKVKMRSVPCPEF